MKDVPASTATVIQAHRACSRSSHAVIMDDHQVVGNSQHVDQLIVSFFRCCPSSYGIYPVVIGQYMRICSSSIHHEVCRTPKDS